MAVYFDQKLESDFNSIKTDCVWHKEYSLLAVLSSNDQSVGTVSIYTEDGELLRASTQHRSSIATSACWHPVRKIISVGWESGDITIHNTEEGENTEAVTVHTSPVTHLAYSSKATHLTSADKAGIVAVWKADARGRLQPSPVHQININEPVTQLLYKPLSKSDSALDIAKLAKAAVSGDEAALDMFTWKKGNNLNLTSSLTQSEALSFFVGGASGGVYCINDNGSCTPVTTVESGVKTLLYYDSKNILVTVTDNLSLTQHSILRNGEAEEINKVKLSGKGDDCQVIWAGLGLLAICTCDVVIRMLDLDKGDNYFLSLESHSGYNVNEGILCLSYCSNKEILAGGTNMGNVAMWTHAPETVSRDTPDPETRWKLHAPSTVEGPITQLQWGSIRNLLAVNTSYNVFMLSEQVMNYSYSNQIAVLQVGPSQLTVDVFSTNLHHDLKTDIQVKGVCTTQDALTIWNGKKAVVYEYAHDKSVMTSSGAFATEATSICMYEQNLYTLEQNKVQVRTYQGTVKQTINFSETEGQPVCLDVCAAYLVIGTISGLVKVYDLTRREAKLQSSPKQISDHVTDFGNLVSAKCNCAGNRISVLVNKSDGHPDDRLYLIDLEMDTVQYFSFLSGHGEDDDLLTREGDSDSVSDTDMNDDDRGKNQAAKDVSGRYPVSHFWDPDEPKLLVCEACVSPNTPVKSPRKAEKVSSIGRIAEEQIAEKLVVTLFSTSENGVLVQGSYPTPTHLQSLLGVHVPYHYFLRKSEETASERETTGATNEHTYPKMVSRQIMRDFVGLEKCDKVTRDAMINFSFYLAIGNMDEAFKAIKLIKSESVWQNMAKMCVKSRRLDVASVCLGNMGHARGAMMLREAMKEPDLDARVAVLAIQLELYEDAERLLRNCKRYDLLNKLYQASDQWDRGMETAEMYDRIHLRSTYYNYGKHLEDQGDLNAAIPNYEKSDTHRFEVPRMFYDEPDSLETYVMNSKDPALRKWWAQYLESTGEMEAALQFYEAAQDYLSLVRVYCFCDNLDKATEICNETGNRAACYHLARQYERTDHIQQAIHFFTRAQAYGNAIRLCKEHNHDDQILNLALLGKPEDMMEAARYFEEYPSMQDKAVMLYHKSGNFTKALDLAFQTKQFGALQLISNQLDERADPELLKRCADFFLDNHQYDKAVELFGLGRKYSEALSVCLHQHVEMTEELAEKLTPAKDDKDYDVTGRNRILEGIAEVAMHQGQWHVATKKFTQAGNKIKAMKSLLKSGDTEKITFFAGVSRQKEIYVMAANYLQSLDWRQDPDIMKNIITFYTKGRAVESLSMFYDACSQIEIDEYQNYEKALGALGEAYKCMSKAKPGDNLIQDQKLESYKNRMELIRAFVTTKREYDEEPHKAIEKCHALLEERDINRAVRIGDVYAFIIAHHYHHNEWKQAHANLEKMRNTIPSQSVQHFLSADTIAHIHDKMGLRFEDNFKRMNGLESRGSEGDMGDEVGEEVIEGYLD